MPNLKFVKSRRGLAAAVLSSLLLLPSIGAANASSSEQILRPARSLAGNYLAAYVAGSSRDAGAAAVFYGAALRDDPQNDELMERAFVSFLLNDDMAEAFRLAERLLVTNQGHNIARLVLGIRDFHEHNYASARRRFSPIGKQKTLDLSSALFTAWTWTAEGNLQKGLAAVSQLKGNRTLDVFRDYNSGLMAQVSGKLVEAEQYLKAAYEADSQTLRIVEAYGRLLSQRGNNALAISVFENFQNLAPAQPRVSWALAQLKAGKTLPPLLSKADEGAAEVLYSLGAAGSAQGEELATVIYLRLALFLHPEHEMAKFALAGNYEKRSQHEQIIKLLTTIPKNSHLYNEAAIQISYSLEQIGQVDEAEKRLTTLAEANPQDRDIAMALGNVLRVRAAKEKNKEKATAFYLAAADNYTKVINLMTSEERLSWPVWFMRGTAYERSKQWDKAESDLKKALSLVPDNQPQGRAQVMNYLAYSWVDANTNIDEAFKLLQNAVELSPRDGMIIDSLGWAYYRLGRYHDAVRELEKAVEYKPGDPVINDHLGDAYWKTGREIEARFQWNHARDSNPDPEDLEKILKKIEHGLQ